MASVREIPIQQRPQAEYRCPKCGITDTQAANVGMFCTNHAKAEKMRQAPLSQGTLDSLLSRRVG